MLSKELCNLSSSDFIKELESCQENTKIFKTNNALEGEFAHLKTDLRDHNGLKLINKMKFISHYFRIKNEQRQGQKRKI